MKKEILSIVMICTLSLSCYAIKQFSINKDNTKTIQNVFVADNGISSEADNFLKNSQKQYEQQINLGFNVKGNLSIKEQCDFLRTELENLRKENIKTDKIWLRLQGGSISQKTYSSDWTDETIIKWAEIQREFGCQYIFTVNFNDSPENQMNFYKRLTDKGIRFDFIELGNEQYLSKFALSKTAEFDEVTERTSNMTPQKYITMCNEYINTFKTFELPFYVQFAPEKENNNNDDWNKAITQAINNNIFYSQNINGTIHLYESGGEGSLNEKQISGIKSFVNHPIHIAVTESGVVDKSSKVYSNEFIMQENNLTIRILNQLQNGDVLLNQVLYTDYKDVGPAAFHPQYRGITPKGKVIFELFKKYW